MDTVLVIVTGVSLALAAGMGMLLARMMREERERSDARVQLLEELAASGSGRPNRLRDEPAAEPLPAKAAVLRYTDTLEAAVPSAAPRRVPTAPSKPRRAVADLPCVRRRRRKSRAFRISSVKRTSRRPGPAVWRSPGALRRSSASRCSGGPRCARRSLSRYRSPPQGLPPPRVPSNYCRCATRTMGIRSR